MSNNTKLGQKFFSIYKFLNKENRTNDKVAIFSEVDMSQFIQFKKDCIDSKMQPPCLTAYITKAVVKAVEIHPHINTVCIGLLRKKKHIFKEIDFTFAVERNLSTGEMVTYASTIRNADKKDLMEIDKELRSLSTKNPELDKRWILFYNLVKFAPKLIAKFILSTPNWFFKSWKKHRGGAFFISSPCKYGGDGLIAAWPWPICFSFGKLKNRPMVVNDKVVVRPTINLTISFDRCYIPGAPAARFFQNVVNCLEKQNFYNHNKKDTNNICQIKTVMVS